MTEKEPSDTSDDTSGDTSGDTSKDTSGDTPQDPNDSDYIPDSEELKRDSSSSDEDQKKQRKKLKPVKKGDDEGAHDKRDNEGADEEGNDEEDHEEYEDEEDNEGEADDEGEDEDDEAEDEDVDHDAPMMDIPPLIFIVQNTSQNATPAIPITIPMSMNNITATESNAIGTRGRKRTRTQEETQFMQSLSRTERTYWESQVDDTMRQQILQMNKKVKEHSIDTALPMRFRFLLSDILPSTKTLLLAKLDQFQSMREGSGEYYKLRNWLQAVSRLPLGKYTPLPVTPSDPAPKIAGFLQNVRHGLDAKVFGHNEAKDQVMRILAQWISNPEARGHCIGIQGPAGVGKCHAKNEPILLFDGSIKKVQDIVVGDRLMGDDSTPREVLALGTGTDDLYEIYDISSGESYWVNSEHILCLQYAHNPHMIVEIPVKEYLHLPEYIRTSLRGYRVPIRFPPRSIPLPMKEPIQFGEMIESQDIIPDEYLLNYMGARHDVVRGAVRNYGPTLTFRNETIAEQFVFLCRSSGIAAIRQGILVQVQTKAENRHIPEFRSVHLYPIDVRKVGHGEYYGFTLDQNHRYVLPDCTVTHNTTLIKEGVCKALAMPFAFVALGGAADGSFLEGHSFTYEGSTYGKVAEVLMKTGCMNPILFFDELDKVSGTRRGDEIIGILTHLTDAAQNERFTDRYFGEIELNLSKSLIVFSYNDESMINPILKDRMICIRVAGYKPKEKIEIARDYLIPEIRSQYNLKTEDITISDEILEHIVNKVSNASQEDGVRELKRAIESIVGWINMHRYIPLPSGDLITLPVSITKEHVKKFMRVADHPNIISNEIQRSMYL